MKKTMKSNKGITIISLVITIIVMLILAYISVAMLTGNNGMIIKSAEARDDTKVSEEMERIKASFSTITMRNLKKADGKAYEITSTDLQEQILADLHQEEGVTVSGENMKISKNNNAEITGEFTVVMPSGNTYTINAVGDVTLVSKAGE